jgi:hypothetical protein
MDARVGEMQAAWDLYGKDSNEADAVDLAWDEVGLPSPEDTPPPGGGDEDPDDPTCLCVMASAVAGGGGLDPSGANVDATLAALLHVRDLIATGETPALVRYGNLFYQYNDRLTALTDANPALKQQMARTIQTVQPAFAAVGTSAGNTTVVTAPMIASVQSLLDAISAADGGSLAAEIAALRAKADLSQLVGRPANQDLSYLDGHL